LNQLKIILIVAGLSLSAHAQNQSAEVRARSAITSSESEAKFFALTPLVGATAFEVQGAATWKLKPGATAGVLAELGTSRTTFQTGVQYLQAGGRSERDGINAKLHLDYLAVPLLVKSFVFAERHGFFVKGGVVPMTNLRAELEFTSRGRTQKQKPSQDLQKNDVLAQAGVGMQSRRSTNGLSFGGDVTFNRGLVKLNKTGDDALHNQGAMLSGFVTF